MTAVLVLADVERGDPPRVLRQTLHLLTLARRFGHPEVVITEPVPVGTPELLGRYGAVAVHTIRTEGLDENPVPAQVDALVTLARRTRPIAVLITSGLDGTQIAARLAVRLDSGILTDVVDLRPGPFGPVATQPVSAGSWRAESHVRRGFPVVTVRPEVTAPEPVEEPKWPDMSTIPVALPPGTAAARVVSRAAKPPSGRPDLADARVVAAGGHGVGSADGFRLVQRLADVLGGAAGASRAVVDEGWCPPELQVGRTGARVAPALYVAAGISGSEQHRAGMHGSRTIVAVNEDPNAPIFTFADFGVVGDLHTVLPRLIDEIGKRRR